MKSCEDYILNIVKGKNVLDIGSCAEQGSLIKPKTLYSKIKMRANSVVGVDIESNSPEIIKGNAENISFKKRFDVIIAGDVIEHIHNPGKFLENMSRHLKKDGLLVIVTPNARSIGYLPFKCNKFHTCWYCEHTLSYLISCYNYRIIKKFKGMRKSKNFINNIFRHYFANNLLFICKKND